MIFSILIPIFTLIFLASSAETNTWKKIDDQYARVGHTFTQLSNGKFLLFGGFDNQRTIQSKCTIFDRTQFADFITQTELQPRAWHSGTQIQGGNNNNGILFFGGIDNRGVETNTSFIIFEDGRVLNTIGSIPPRANFSLASTKDHKYAVLFGGSYRDNKDLKQINTIHLYISQSNQWVNVNNVVKENINPPFEKDDQYYAEWIQVSYRPLGLPPRSFHHSHSLGSSMVFIWGGSSSDSEINLINLNDKSWSTIQLNGTRTPPLSVGFASAFDEERNTLYVHGGLLENDFNGDKVEDRIIGNINYIILDQCAQWDNCGQCIQKHESQCLWCSSKSKCMSYTTNTSNINTYNEINPMENCASFSQDVNSCPSCEQYDNCNNCTQNKNCGWCQLMQAYPSPVFGCFESSKFEEKLDQTLMNIYSSSFQSSPYVGICSQFASSSDQCALIETKVIFAFPKAPQSYQQQEPYYPEGLDDQIDVAIKGSTNLDPHFIRAVLILKQIYPASDEEIVVGAVPVRIRNAEVTFIEPSKEGQNVTGPEYTIKWLNPDSNESVIQGNIISLIDDNHLNINSDSYSNSQIEQITLQLRQQKQNKAKIEIVSSDDDQDTLITSICYNKPNLGYFVWQVPFMLMLDEESYYISILWNRQQQKPDNQSFNDVSSLIKIGQSPNFFIKMNNAKFEITNPLTPQDIKEQNKTAEILPGSLLNVSYKIVGGYKPILTAVQLMLGTEQTTNPQLIEIIGRVVSGPQNESEFAFPWVVNVQFDSPLYFFRVEDLISDSYTDSDRFFIRASKIEVSLSRGWKKQGSGELSDSKHEITFTFGEKITLFWEYVGGESEFSIFLVSEDGAEIGIADNIAVNTSQFQFIIPEGKEKQDGSVSVFHHTLYVIRIIATTYQGRLNGSSVPFLVLAPGAAKQQSMISFFAGLTIAIVAALGSFFFWVFWYRRSRIGGFQRI
ncbi:MAG: hypothetical protein EZS28_016739 [Streblomastix strix]|uniref:PSI domain-containing protein n=1 Tax=Streblomastix strix TaxID=222440 RepID=A0A5J4VYJ7_9EUKA|nr:MAG: hypothetical protein EZS28_016739 [Streblomastix strix]